jgi:hypothetical protein
MSILVPITHTTPQIEGITRNELFKRLLRETGVGIYGTATGGSTTTIEDTARLKSTQYNNREHVGGWGRIGFNANSVGASPENQQSPVTTYIASTGIITLNPAVSAIQVSDEYQIWHMINPTFVKDLLDTLLTEEIYLPYWSLLSEVPDFDMEQNNTTDWTDSNATGTKVTDEPRLGGVRNLKVITSSTNGYSRPPLFNVEPGKPYHVSALCAPQGAFTGRLQVYDETNSAAIDSKDVTGRINVRVYFDFTTPATCEQISIRLIGVENSNTCRWNDVVLYPQGARDIALPWWVKNKGQVKQVFQLLPNEVGNSQWDDVLRGEPVYEWDIRDSAFGRGQLRIVARQGVISNPLFIFGARNETAYSNDTVDKKFVDENFLLAGLAFKMYEYLSKPSTRGVANRETVREELVKWQRKWERLQQQQAERLVEVLTSITPDSRHYSDLNFGRYT